MADSSDIYKRYLQLRNSDRWQRLPEEAQQRYTDFAKQAHSQTLEQELKAPIVTPYDTQAPVEYEEVTPLTTFTNTAKSFGRIPSSIVSTGATGVGYGLDLLGADNAAKTMYDTANQVDKQAQEYLPNTFKPIEGLDEFKQAFDSPGNFFDLAGKISSVAPEVIGSSVAMAAPGAGLAKVGSLLGKSGKAINAIRLAGLGLGSTAASGGGIQRNQYNKTGQLANPVDALPYALGVGALDFLPGTMEQGISKWLAGQGGDELIKRGLLNTGKDMFKSGATEFVQEGAQGGIEGSYEYKDQGFLPSLQSGFTDPNVQSQMLQEGLAAALSNVGGTLMSRAGNQSNIDIEIPANFKNDKEALGYINQVAGLTDQQREAMRQKIADRNHPFKKQGGAVLPTAEELDQKLMTGMASAEQNQRTALRNYFSQLKTLREQNTPDAMTRADQLEKGFSSQFANVDPYYIQDEMNRAFSDNNQAQAPTRDGKSLIPQKAEPQSVKPQGYVETDGLAGLRGKPTKIRTPRGFEVEGEYRIVEADAGRNSFNDGYSMVLQDRDTNKATSREQIDKIRDKVIPGELIADFEGADVGAPIMGVNPEDGQLETEIGNHRDQGIREGYQNNQYQAYKDLLLEKAKDLGFNPDEIAAMKSPKLVRVRTTELDPETRMAFANSGNAPRAMAKSAAETAVTDAKYVGPALSEIQVTEDGKINTAGNRDFFRRFLGEVATPQELNRLISRDGNSLTQEGVNRMRNAIFAAAYENTDLVERLADSTDERIKRVLSGMTAAAADTAVMRNEIKRGNLHDYQIADDLAIAADKLAEIRNSGNSVDGYLSQGQFFDDGMTAESRQLLKVIDRAKSSRAVAELIKDFNSMVRELGHPGQGRLFDDAAPPSKESILDFVISRDYPDLASKKEIAGQDPGAAEKTAAQKAGLDRVKEAIKTAQARVESNWNNADLTEADLPQFSRKRSGNQPGLFDAGRQPTLFEWLAKKEQAETKVQQPTQAKTQERPTGSDLRPVQKTLLPVQGEYVKKVADAVKTVSGLKTKQAESANNGYKADSVNGIYIVRGPDGQAVKDFMSTSKAMADEKAAALNANFAKSGNKTAKNNEIGNLKENEEKNSGGHAIIAPDGSQYSWGTNREEIESRAEELNSAASKTEKVEETAQKVTQEKPYVTLEPKTNIKQEGREELRVSEKKEVDASQPAKTKTSKPTPGKIEDFGEKIGDARKDRAIKPGKKGKKVQDSRPAWQRRFVALEAADSGKWQIFDLKTNRPIRSGWNTLTFDSLQEAEGAIPLIAVSQKHRVVGDDKKDGEYRIIRKVTDRKIVTIKRGFKSEDEAKLYMVKNAPEIIEQKTNYGEEILAKPEKAMRTGRKVREGNVSPEDFKEFGFRGVEFGNWNNQEERQEVMNHAYDGLYDLAETLKVPVKALSLNGELSLAFGARGVGLSGAKAHYEPVRGVINLTKMSGAGSLAHEWFHALDHYLARQSGKTPSEMTIDEQGLKKFDIKTTGKDSSRYMASHGTWFKSKLRKELKEAYDSVIDTILTKGEEYVEDTIRADKALAAKRKRVEDYLGRIKNSLQKDYTNDKYYKRLKKPATKEQLDRFEVLAEKIRSGQANSKKWYSSDRGWGGRWSNEILEELSALLKKVRGRSGWSSQNGIMDYLSSSLSSLENAIKLHQEATRGDVKTKKVKTSFVREATEMDRGRTGTYWSSEHELAARAFSAYVEDKIKDKSNVSDFLVYGSNNDRFEYRLFDVRPFPEGSERKTINRAFDKLFETFKTKETEKGVALYSRNAKENEVKFRRETKKQLTSSEKLERLEKIMANQEGNNGIIGSFKEVEAKSVKEGAAVAKAFNTLFGKQIVFFDAGTTLKNKFHGVVAPSSMPDTIFIDSGSDKAALRVAGHELMHLVKVDSPETYKNLTSELQALMTDKAFPDYQKRLKDLGGENLSDNAVIEELVGDFVGDQMANQAFWGKLARKDPSLFKRVAVLVQDLFARIKNWLAKNDYQTTQFFKDIEAAQDAVVKNIASYGQIKAEESGIKKVEQAVRRVMTKKAYPKANSLQKVAKAIAEAKKDRSGSKVVAEAIKTAYSYAGRKATEWDKAKKADKIFAGPYDNMPRFEIDDSKAHWKIPSGSLIDDPRNQNQMAVEEDLGDIFDHPQLFKNYPSLKSLPVKLLINPEFAPTGGFYSGTKTIVLAVPDLETGRRVLLHEIQHSIQDIENFAKGSNKNQFQSSTIEEARKNAARQFMEKAREVFNQATPEFQSAARKMNREFELYPAMGDQSEAYFDARQELYKVSEEDATDYLFYSDLSDRTLRGDNDYDINGYEIRPESAYDKYHKAAGEIEARDVEDRMDLTAKEREEFEPFSSAEYDIDDAIVMYSFKAPIKSEPEKLTIAKWAWRKFISNPILKAKKLAKAIKNEFPRLRWKYAVQYAKDTIKRFQMWPENIANRVQRIKDRYLNDGELPVKAGLLKSMERRKKEVDWAKFMLDGRDVAKAAIKRAEEIVAKQPQFKAVYVELDIKNQKGINSFFNEVYADADVNVLGPFAEIFREEVEKISQDVLFAKAGGDEWGAVIITPKELSTDVVREYARIANSRAVEHAVSIGISRTLENPREKRPKALYRAVKQLKKMGGDHGSLESILYTHLNNYLTARGTGFRIGVEDIDGRTPEAIFKGIGAQHDAEKHRNAILGKDRRRKHSESGVKTSKESQREPGNSLYSRKDGSNSQLDRPENKLKFSLSKLESIAKNPDQVTDDDPTFLQQAKHFVTHGLVHLTSEIAEMDPAFKRIVATNPDARTSEELLRALKVAKTDKSRKAEDEILAAHIRADNSKLIDLVIKFTKPGPFRDWLMKKIRRIVAPFHQAQNIQKVMFMLAERIYWNGEKMVAAPGFRTQDESGQYVYTWENSLVDGETALKAFNELPQDLKSILIERAKKNEQYRQEFVGKWVPRQKATIGLGAMARLLKQVNAGEERSARNQHLWDKLTTEIDKTLTELRSKLSSKKGQAAVKQLRGRFEFLKNRYDQDNSGILKTLETIPHSERSIDSLMHEYNNISNNQGHFGYVHHAFESRLSKNLSPGSGFDASGKFDHPWFETISDTNRIREGGAGRVGSLMQADIAQRIKEIRADERNNWMASVEDEYGIPVESAQDAKGDISLPEGYNIKSWVVANFGKFAGQKLYIPTNMFALYKQTLERGTVDPELKEISGILDSANQAVSLINEAMLYHTAKAARDLFSVPFHIVEFIRDWTMKNPEDWLDVWKLLGKGMKAAVTPSEWQRMNPASFGEYSESLAFQNRNQDSLITKALNVMSGNKQAGSVLASLLRQINLAGAADLPVKRIMRTVGEGLADKRGLSGQKRERFVYKIMNQYAFDTGDLPGVVSFIRGGRPDSTSKVLGAISRGTIPFMGYATRLARQMLITPFTHGVMGMGERTDLKYRAAEITRPLVWMAFAMLVRAGGLGNPPEEEGAAIGLKNKRNLDYAVRTATRVLVKKDEDKDGGEYYMSSKGYGHLSMADTVYGALSGQQTFGDVVQELGNLHPVAKTMLSTFGMEDPYSKYVPFPAKLGRLTAMMLMPQFTRIGPDVEKTLRLVFKNGALPDTTRDTFFKAFVSQLGIPASDAKYRNGKLVTTKAWIEAIKMAGVNIRYIPYEIVEGEVNKEIPSLKRVAEKIREVKAHGDKPWKGKTTKEGKPMNETQWLISKGLLGKGRSLKEAREVMEKELQDRSSGLSQTVKALKRVGYNRFDNVVDYHDDYAKKVQSTIRKISKSSQGNIYKRLLKSAH